MRTAHEHLDGAGTPGTGAGAVGVEIHRVGPEDWAAHRALRLEMLRTDPDAFWASLAELEGWTEEQWRADTAGPRLHLQARSGEVVLGGIGVLPEGYTPEHLLPEDAAHLVSMWVHPAARGRGVSALLLRGAAQVALELGRPRLLLDVDARNLTARRSYERSGFRATGATDPRDGTDSHWVEYAADAAELLGR